MTLTIVLVYLGLGILVSFLFDLFTGRIRRGMANGILTVQGSFGTGYKTSIAVILVASVVLWPALIIGAVTKYGRDTEVR